jgi:SAM-dependent methyltransferase
MLIKYSYHYSKWHPDTEEHFVATTLSLQRRYGMLLPTSKDEPILDVGCGMGFFLSAARSLGYKHVEGIDIDSDQINLARRRGLSVELVDDSAKRLLETQEKYAFIGCFDVLEHLSAHDQLRLVKAIYNALKPGGRFVVKVPNANSAFASRMRYIDFTHKCAFTEHSLDFLLHECGFRDIRTEEEDIRPRWPWLIRPRLMLWYLGQMLRTLRRFQAIAEFGPKQGLAIPLSLNLVGVSTKSLQ